jgi:HSP20 family protein
MKTKHNTNEDKPRGESILGLGGIFSGLSDLVGKLNELAETGEELRRTGEIHGAGKEVKGIYGFTVKVGLGGKAPHIESFGNIRKDKKTGEAVVQEIHEPLIDVFEDKDATTLIAEMPGVGPDDIKIDLRDDVLTVSAQKGAKKYRKEILLSHSPAKDKIKVTSNNGIVTIRCAKA